jgi:CDP-ribitol ribitolphosphotransferase / teichoic acid ribitol-phosphate polymerase
MPKIKHWLLQLAVWLLTFAYAFIKLFPTKNKVVFLSRQTNTPSIDFILLAQEISRQFPGTKIITLTKKIETPLYFLHIFRQMYHIATARVAILDSYCIPISVLKHKDSLMVVQIWHALGSMKKFGYAMIGKPEGNSEAVAKILCMHKNYDAILISSFSFIKDFIEGFGTDGANVVEIPLPKVDILTNPAYRKAKKEEILINQPILRGKKNILYCSTFRKDTVPNSEHIDRLAACIDFTKYNLLFKPHPLSNVVTRDQRIITDFADTFEALFVADAVITDYSSIIYEIGLLDLPVYIYAYDWEQYKMNREFNLDLEHDIPTLFTANPKEIVQAIESNAFNHDAFRQFVGKNVSLKHESCTKDIVALFHAHLLKD